MRKGENALTRYEWKKASVQYYFLLGWMGYSFTIYLVLLKQPHFHQISCGLPELSLT